MMNRRIGSMLVAMALTVSASAAWACDRHADAAEAKDAKTVAANGETKGCSMPCCAKAKATAVTEKTSPHHDAKDSSAKAAVATTGSKAKSAPDGAPAAPAPDAGTNR